MKVPAARKLSSGTWFIQLRLGGESIPVSASTEKECIRQAQYVKAEYMAGKRTRLDSDGSKKEKLPTLEEAIDIYVEMRSNTLSPATLRGYNGIKRNRFKSLMSKSLSDITDKEYLAACNQEAAICSAKTLKNAWGLICSVVQYVAGHRPPDAPLPQVVPNERPFLDAQEIRIFIKAIHGSKYEIPALLALSSMRRSEIFGLTWENVDLKKKCILVKGAVVPDQNHHYVRKKENKNRSSTRYIPILMDELYDAMRAEKDKSGPVAKCHPEGLRRAINQICKENGLPQVGVHGLRHSFASLAYHLNVPEKYTMEIGGWKDNQTMRKIYTHIAKSDMSRYENKFSDFFKNANKNANNS